MKAFVISEDQVASIAAALISEELGANFGRHVDTAAVSGWNLETPLFDGGADLSAAEAAACLARLQRFFGAEVAPMPNAAAIGDWAAAVADAASRKLSRFSFVAAGGADAVSVHDADAVFSDAAAVANLLYGRRRILSLVAPHGLIGFVLTVLVPNLLQAPSIDARRMTVEEISEALSFGDALVATPSLWRYLTAQGLAAPANAMAVSFGELLTPELSAAIRKAGFGAQREVYGSTETGLVGWRDAPGEPFALLEQWRRDGDDLLRFSPSGEARRVASMDVLRWDGERRFTLCGRRDGAVQIGAVNVFPAEIARKIAEHPLVEACEVVALRDHGGGDRLVATIRLRSNGAPRESAARAIDSWCRAKLRPCERPRVYNYADPAKP